MRRATEIAPVVKTFLDNAVGIDAAAVDQTIDGCTVYLMPKQHCPKSDVALARLRAKLFQAAPLAYVEIFIRPHNGREVSELVPRNMHIFKRAVS